MAVGAITKEAKPSTPKSSKPLVTGLTKSPASTTSQGTANAAPKGTANAAPKGKANAAPKGTANAAPKGKANAAPKGTVNGASTRKLPAWKVQVRRTSAKAQVASTMKTKATGVPKTKVSGTPTGHGTGQQHQQSNASLAVPGAGQQRRVNGQPVRPPPTQDGWDLTAQGSVQVEVPELVLNNDIKDVFVEFLQVGNDPQAKNHAAFKIDFVPGPDDTYPGNYAGVRVHMEADLDAETEHYDGLAYQPGTLLVKPVEYADKSNGSVRTFKLRPGPYALKLHHILGLIVNYFPLGEFSFRVLNRRYYGCRDFITQAIRILEHERHPYISSTIADVKPATPPLPGITNIYQALGCRFRLDDPNQAGMDGQYTACPVDKGVFKRYQRIKGNEMPYI